jgi:TPR repeat protein
MSMRSSPAASEFAFPEKRRSLFRRLARPLGDLIAARILFVHAANAGNAAAAIAMGSTCDPVVLADHGVRGLAPDLDKARRWYEKAKEMASPEGPRRLEMVANR